MRILNAIIAVLDAVTALFGKTVSWLVLFMIVATFANVVLRYVYGISIVALHESVVYAFGIVLTATAGWALLKDEHVRVDIVYRGLGARGRALVDAIGSILLLSPVLWLIATRGYPYVARSWKIGEGSTEIAGLQFVYLLKAFILVFVGVLAVQGLSLFLKCLRTLAGGTPPAENASEGNGGRS